MALENLIYTKADAVVVFNIARVFSEDFTCGSVQNIALFNKQTTREEIKGENIDSSFDVELNHELEARVVGTHSKTKSDSLS